MKMKFINCTVALSVAALFLSTTAFAQKPKESQSLSPKKLREMEKNGLKPPSGPSFFIGPVDGSPLFSILLSDSSGKSVSDSFNPHQVEVFEAVVQAAKDFAFSDEAVGVKAPITTRLMDQHEWSLFVDVSKMGDKSTIYLSIISMNGRLTVPAGEITRGSKKEQSALLFEVLSRIQNARAGIKLPQ